MSKIRCRYLKSFYENNFQIKPGCRFVAESFVYTSWKRASVNLKTVDIRH